MGDGYDFIDVFSGLEGSKLGGCEIGPLAISGLKFGEGVVVYFDLIGSDGGTSFYGDSILSGGDRGAF